MGQPKTGVRDRGGHLGKQGQPVRAPRGANLSCQGWTQEAALRMLMNSLDPDVAEQPSDLIACGATAKVLRDWESFHATVEALKALKNDETLLVESGKPGGVVKTHQEAPRVLIFNANLSTRRPVSENLQPRVSVQPQGSSASWTYVGTQETLPTAFLVFDAIGRNHFSGDLTGKLVVSGGMGAAGGALSLAAGMLGAAFLGIDVDGERIRRRIRAGYCDYCVNSLDEALRILKNAVRRKQGVSVGLVGNCADVVPELASRGVLPDILTDQTSTHDLLYGYVPSGITLKEAGTLRRENPEEYLSRSRDSLARHFNGILALQKMGSIAFEFGNDIRAVAEVGRVVDASSALVNSAESYLQPLLDEGMVPVRWVALSGVPGDVLRLDDLAVELFPDEAHLARWIPLARKYMRFQGLPARVCWMHEETQVRLAERVNGLVAEGVFKAPMVMALDQAATGVGPSHNAESKNQKGASTATSNFPALIEMLNIASGAGWLSLEIGVGCSRATVVLVADGTPQAAEASQSVLKNGYALEIIRQAAGGFE